MLLSKLRLFTPLSPLSTSLSPLTSLTSQAAPFSAANTSKFHPAGPQAKPSSAKYLTKRAVDVLEQGAAEDVKVLSVGPRCSFAQYMVFATGLSSTHRMALAADLEEYVQRKLVLGRLRDKEGRETSPSSTVSNGIEGGVEFGAEGDEWLLIDLGTVVVHIFSESGRAKYNLEELWTARLGANADKDLIRAQKSAFKQWPRERRRGFKKPRLDAETKK